MPNRPDDAARIFAVIFPTNGRGGQGGPPGCRASAQRVADIHRSWKFATAPKGSLSRRWRTGSWHDREVALQCLVGRDSLACVDWNHLHNGSVHMVMTCMLCVAHVAQYTGIVPGCHRTEVAEVMSREAWSGWCRFGITRACPFQASWEVLLFFAGGSEPSSPSLPSSSLHSSALSFTAAGVCESSTDTGAVET